MLRVDCQTHVFPRAYAELLLKNTTPVRTVKSGDAYVISYGDLQTFALSLEPYDPRAKIRDMDEAEIDVSVLTVNIPGPELLTPELGVQGARICNDYLAELCAQHPGRFVGLATLPLQDMPAAMAEYRRAIHDLGLRGIFLFSHIAGKPLDAPEFEPLYDNAERDRVPLVLHPTVPTWGEVVKDYSMIPMIGLMVDTSIAMLRLILNGTLERHPDLLIVHPHCGGVLPYLMPRVEEQTEVKRRGREHICKPPGEYYRNVYLDIVSPSALAMEFAYRSSRPDRLLFGSDHPWVKIEAILEHFNRLQIPEAEKAMILGENACRLFRIS
jgi:predicted TIM-barrel fold metal-dependent hydrolase